MSLLLIVNTSFNNKAPCRERETNSEEEIKQLVLTEKGEETVFNGLEKAVVCLSQPWFTLLIYNISTVYSTFILRLTFEIIFIELFNDWLL